MSTPTISPEAEQDLLDIWLYITADSPINADRFIERLEAKALKLARFTEIGVERPELVAGLKSFPVDRYVLYYRVSPLGIELIRVLHGARDIGSHF